MNLKNPLKYNFLTYKKQTMSKLTYIKTSLKSSETTNEQNMTLFLMLSYNKMKLYNENFSNLQKVKEGSELESRK